jgi:hypothetical protein
MAETANIAKIAEKLSKDVFSEFFWTRTGPTNQNWNCGSPDLHKAKTHPSDVVFFYDEPYSKARTYINCDLKSYSKNSIKAQSIANAIESLARATSCLEVSGEWRDLYIHEHVTPAVCSLLFVYNHDGEYDKDFRSMVNTTNSASLQLPAGSKLVVLGPADIFWLDNVRIDIALMRGQGRLPKQEHTQFSYPHLVRRPNVQLDTAKAATLEMLTAPWILLEYRDPSDSSRRGVHVFYRQRGEDVGEFMYLIDYLKHYQVLASGTSVVVKTLDTAPHAHVNFQKAVQRYSDECGSNTPIANLLQSIQYEKMTQISSIFSEIDIGMSDG